MSGHSSSVWGHSVHSAKFPMLRFLKGYCSHNFHSVSTKLYGKHGNQRGIQAITFFVNPPKIKTFSALLNFLLTQEMGLEISKRYSYIFHPLSAKLYADIGYHGGIQAITFLGNQASFKNFVAL